MSLLPGEKFGLVLREPLVREYFLHSISETWFGLHEAPDEAPDEVWEEEGEVRDKVVMKFQIRNMGYPGLLTGSRSETAEIALHARLATEDPAGISSAICRGG